MSRAKKSELRVAVVDNSVNPAVYKPVEHWASFLPVPFLSFRATEGQFPALRENFTHFILTGSEASIVEREGWVEDEVRFVREVMSRGFPVLGSCYGHQLLALALRGPDRVRRCPRPEIGWHPIDIRGRNGLLGQRRTITAFSSHFDEVTGLDKSFRVLASTPGCRVQAFELKGAPVWGLQFHPEMDIPAASEYLRNLAGLGLSTSPLFAEALRMKPRDSGVIRRVVACFLASSRRT
jgi:GMP synthase-like glutamine amidotransferase